MTPGNAGGLIGKTLGDYELRALLGAGGMAEVYRGYDVKLGREVAVKVLPASLALDAGYVERFRDEARRVAALTHPNVVPVYHYGEEHGLLYLVMPVLKESLRDRMEREGTLPPSDAAKLTVQIAAALDAAHSQGIVHRDVKPENILLNNEGKAHLTDFGIAREMSFLKQTGSNRTLASTGLPVGTPEYMAPEQLRMSVVDQRADVYALGAVLYELLTGTVPHDAPTPYEVAALVLTAPTMPPSQRNPEIWPELESVVMTAIEKDAKDRFHDARSFAMALRRSVLQRDPNAPRLTMPAAANYTGAPLMPVAPGTGPLILQGPSGPLVLDPTMSPMSGPLGPVATSAPAVWTADPRRGSKLRPRPMGRKAALAAVIIVLVLVAVCGGSSLAMLSGLFGPTAATDLRFPIGNGLTGATNTQTVTDGGDNSTGTGIGTTTTGQATFPPGVTATVGSDGATPTAVPTATTPPPPPLAFSGNLVLTPAGDGFCTGTMTITNNSRKTISWVWTPSKVPGELNNFNYYLGNQFALNLWPPHDSGLAAGATDMVHVAASCSSKGPWTNLAVKDSTFGENLPFTLSIGN